MDRLIAILRASQADAWEIRETRTKGWEFYFIKHQLDQHRVKEVRHVNLTVYKKSEEGKYIGFANAEVYPDDSDEALAKQIDSLIYSASLVKNPVYTLNQPKESEPFVHETYTVRDISKDFIQLMDELKETETEYINSYEIFVNEETVRLITSEGIDVTETSPSSMMEVVVNAKDEAHEIELYRMYRSGTCDADAVVEDLEKTMRYGRDRLRTVSTMDTGNVPVVFTDGNAVRIAEFFLDKTDAALVYRRMSSWKKGEPCGENLSGDKVTLRALRHLDNSPSNRAYDREGAPIKDLVLIDEGIVKAYHGNRMFSQYIGNEDSFIVSNFELSGGTASEEEITAGSYLEAVEFSDFQVDSLTGDIFGEIRLAYWHDGNTVTPVSGGSVSGNMNELMKTMRMSREMKQLAGVRIPAAIRLENVTLSGNGE